MEQRDSNFDRRKFIKGAATVAWATPLILTLGASQAGAQIPSPGSCVGAIKDDGCPCVGSSDCTGGCCCTAPSFIGGLCTDSGTCGMLSGTCLA
jgi:hypothetical protein